MPIEKSSPTVFTQLDDGTGVLLNLETLLYFSLNRTGVVLWKQIEGSESLEIDDLVCSTCERFNVGEQAARKEIETFVERLRQFTIVQVS